MYSCPVFTNVTLCILSVEMSTDFLFYQVDADQATVGSEGEVDFKQDAKFASHLKEKGEAVSEFAKSKTLSEQRHYLPIFSVRDDVLQACQLLFIF